MTESESFDKPAPNPWTALRAARPLIPLALSLGVFMCSCFAAIASAVVVVALPLVGIEESSGFYMRTGVKAAGFTALALGAYWGLRNCLQTFPPRLPATPLGVEDNRGGAWFCVLIVVVFMLMFPRLGSYPWTAPDELHHLSVVRNLAENGLYASGHPDGDLIEFDSYDSVGPAVIVPVSMSRRLADSSLATARLPMAAMCIVWLVLTWLLLRPIMGERPAVIGAALAITAVGTIYLGRTVYGEVPALMYAAAGLLYWRMALGRRRHRFWSILAGLCFGFAMLSKTIFALAAFPVLAVFVFDRMSYRRVPFSRIVWPAAAAALAVGSWFGYLALQGDSGGPAAVHLYRHYLLFGFESVPSTLGWMAEHWPTFLLLMVGYLSILPLLFLIRYDPPTIVLTLIGVQFAFWWVFFTPGQIPRYLWYTLAVGGFLAGPVLFTSLRTVLEKSHSPSIRLVSLAFVALVLTPSVSELQHVLRIMWTERPMQDEYALAEYLNDHPSETIVTTSWMAQRSANFFANRHLPRVSPEQIQNLDRVVVRDRFLEELPDDVSRTLGSGRYVLVLHGNTDEAIHRESR